MDNKQKKLVFLGCLLVGVVGTSFLAEPFKPKPKVAMPVVHETGRGKKSAKQTKIIKVYVSGAVVKPGLYDLPAGTRALAAVERAGGFSKDANVERVNLARILRDGSHVNVPRVKVARKNDSQSKGTQKQSKSTTRKQKQAKSVEK